MGCGGNALAGVGLLVVPLIPPAIAAKHPHTPPAMLTLLPDVDESPPPPGSAPPLSRPCRPTRVFDHSHDAHGTDSSQTNAPGRCWSGGCRLTHSTERDPSSSSS